MGIEIRYDVLKNPNYKEIAYCIGDNPKQERWRQYSDWGTELLKFHAPDTNLYIGALEGDELVGCMIAHSDTLTIQKNVLKAAVIAITEVRMSHRNRGIATEMLQKMLEQVESLGFDLALAFHTQGRGGRKILKQAGFHKIHKYGHGTKVLDAKKMEQLIEFNPILKKAAMMFLNSDIGQSKPLRGTIREARDEDSDQIVALLNTWGEGLDISSVWTSEYLKKNMDWRYRVFVFEDKGTILGSVIVYEEIGTGGREYFMSAFLKELVFREDVREEEQEIFIYNVLNRLKKEGMPNVSFPAPKPQMKILKKTGFRVIPADHRNVFVKTLSDSAKKTIASIEKFRKVNVFLIC